MQELDKSKIVKKGDFIEIDFTARVKGGEIFDTTNKEKAKFLSKELSNVKPVRVCVGEGMLVQGFDESLIGKEINKRYVIEVPPEKAFGKRNPSLFKTLSLKVFSDQKINPQRGMVFTFDNLLAKVVAVSGGRVILDFNNPLAGKEIIYEFEILRKITSEKEKVESLIDFFFKQKLDFEISDKKILIKLPPQFSYFQSFKEKFEKILSKPVEFEVIETQNIQKNK